MFYYWVLNIQIIALAVFGRVTCINFVKESDLDASLQITTDKGIIQGHRTTTNNGIKVYWAFQGIPYASPPIGSLRFRAPKPSRPWNGVLDASREPQSCVETYFRSTGVTANGTEDCMFLNVFSPQDPRTTVEPLPVLVWFYGGAFIEGNSSTKMYGPDFLLRQDMIVVTFNYRVGIFGFLSTGDLSSPGNYGLKDQLLALQWVQRNIRRFGGDENRVTIFGQSAGAASVFYHLASPKSSGLFHRAIANSGSSLCTFAYQRRARDIAAQIAGAIGLSGKNTKELVATLRKTSIERLNDISINLVVLALPSLNHEGFPFSPVIEPNHKGAFISDSTYTLFEKGHFNRVPVLMGVNSLESIFFTQLIEETRSFGILYDFSPGSFTNPSLNIKSYDEKREVGIKVKNHYFRSRSYFEGTKQERLLYVNDDQFVRPIRKTAELISRYIPVYFYIFSYQSSYGIRGFDDYLKDETKGVSHAEELPFIWKFMMRAAPKGLDAITVARVTKLYSNFANTGNPTPVKDVLLQNLTWPTYNNNPDMTYLEINKKMSIGRNLRAEHVQFWNNIYEEYGVKPFVTY